MKENMRSSSTENEMKEEDNDGTIDRVILLGHWSAPNYGSYPNMNTERLFHHLNTNVEGCNTLGSKFKFLQGERER